MVEMVNGGGSRLSFLCKERGLEYGSENLIFFREGRPHNDPVERVLERLFAFPESDAQSIFFTNVIDRRRRSMEALWVPDGCPKLIGHGDKEIGRFPDKNETFMILAWKRSEPDKKHQIPIIAKDLDYLGRIVKDRAKKELKCPMDKIGWEVLEEGVPPDEFIEALRLQIDKGIRLPKFMLEFADLQEYAQRRRRERGNAD